VELVKVAFAALGAVIGLFAGGAVASMFVPAQKEVLAVAVGALVGSLLLAWLGLRLASLLDRPSRTQ